ncbi:hypothetical protein AB3S75_041206 [Citrus x aurantiifolia]
MYLAGKVFQGVLRKRVQVSDRVIEFQYESLYVEFNHFVESQQLLGTGGIMSSSAAETSSMFYSIILPSTIHNKMLRIPPKFVGQFGDELSSVAKLAVPDGRVWQVGLTKFGRKIWFHQGWQNFVESQSISAGYFLLFKYEKNSIFRVLIFDMTACEIDYPYEDDMACEMCVEISEEQFKHEAELLSRKRKMEDGLERDEPNAEPDLLVSLRKSGIYITEKYKELYSTEELERAVYIARAFKATNPKPNPLFMIIWKANDKPCREVYAPARFAYQYVDEDSKSVEVQAPSGRKWSLGIHWRATGGFFLAKGWAGVSDYVHLTEGDICIFELVRHRDVVFKLHVFHQ